MNTEKTSKDTMITIPRERYGFLVFNTVENLIDKGYPTNQEYEEVPKHWEIKIKELKVKL